MDKTVMFIPATNNPFYTDLRVGIYCRVSSSAKDQLRSMAAQVSGLTRYVIAHPSDEKRKTRWLLADIYIDVAPGKDNNREQYQRMLADAKSGKINLIVVKSSSRLGRDTVETIQACRELAAAGCDIYFHNADSFYSERGSLIAEITAAYDQADNESRSENTRWGIRRGLESGTSTIYDRACYGYEHDDDGRLIIKEEEAVVVRKVFLLYLSGASILKIKRTLEEEEIPAPRGGKNWPKKTIDQMLSNSKYVGTSYGRTRQICESDSSGIISEDNKGNRFVTYGSFNNHPAIVSTDIFEKVQQMRMERSNIVYNEDGTTSRKSTHYSSKAAAKERAGADD